jgi:uncharacterized protein YuzE
VLTRHAHRARNTGAVDWLVRSARLVVAYNSPPLTVSPATSLPSGGRRSIKAMKIDGHYDPESDIAWLRFDGYDPATVIAEETDFGLRELSIPDRQLVGLEYWRASERLPSDLLAMLPAPPVGVAR